MANIAGTALNLCLKTEELLSRVSGTITPENVNVRPLGTWHAIQDSMTEGINSINQLLKGKQIPKGTTNAGDRVVQLEYWQPDCAAAAQCSAIDFTSCTDVTDDVNAYAYDQFYPNSYVCGQFEMEPNDYIDNCIDTVMDFRRKLEQEVRKMMKSENDTLASQLGSAAGNYASLSGAATVSSLLNPKTLNLWESTAPVKPQPMAWYPVVREYEDMGVEDRKPYLVSGSRYFRAFKWSSKQGIYVNNVDGFDPGSLGDLNGYVDRRFDTTLTALAGSDRMVSFLAGSVANINWFEYETEMLGTNAPAALGASRSTFAPVQNSGTVVRQKMDVGSALFGTPYEVDMFIYYNECGRKISFKMRRYFDLWRIPDAAFVAACDQAHNYILLWSTGSTDLTAANVIQ